MATHTINIQVNTVGAGAASKSLGGIGTAAGAASDTTQKLLGYLKAFTGITGVVALAREYISLADSFTILRNRVNSANASMADNEGRIQELVRIAEVTSSTPEEISRVYQNLKFATDGLKLSEKELFAVTDELTKAFVITTGDGAEAGRAIQQLTGAFEQGEISGRRLSSLFATQPALVNALAKSMGVTTIELRNLGNRGALSAQDLIDGLRGAEPEINAEFSKIKRTYAGAFRDLSTSVANFVDDPSFDKFAGILSATTGANRSFDSAFNLIGDRIGANLPDKKDVAIRFTTPFQEEAIRKSTDALNEQNAVLSDQIKLGQEVGAQTKLIQGLHKDGVITQQEANRHLKEGLTPLAVALRYGHAIKDDQLAALQSAVELSEDLKTRESIISKIGGTQEDYNRQLRVTANLLAEAKDTSAALYELQLKQRADHLAFDPRVGAGLLRGELLVREDQGNNRGIADAVLKSYKEAAGAAKDYSQAVLAINQNLALMNITQAEALIQLSEARVTYLQTQRDLKSALESGSLQVGLLKIDNRSAADDVVSSFKAATEPARQYSFVVAAVNQNLKELNITQAEANKQLLDARIAFLDTRTDASAGAERSLLKLNQEATDTATQVERTFTDAFSSMEDAFVSFTHTGKLDFSRFADSVLDDLTRIFLKMTIEAPLTKGLGSFLGYDSSKSASGGFDLFGLIGGFLGGKAGGGSVYSNRPVLVGERGPEIFNPSSNGTIIPNGGLAAPTVKVNVVNVSDPDEVAAALNDPKAHAAILNVVRRNPGGFKQVLGINK